VLAQTHKCCLVAVCRRPDEAGVHYQPSDQKNPSQAFNLMAGGSLIDLLYQDRLRAVTR
jgi:hypothetical protein